ncbi:hypothetical protein BP6252_10046 [Coleophoma cylindrospora]|uniref:Transmembrane protein 135 N-terminal domain-containing protein n=1 Tax=Coleophoma cylindrospora TaxID=1849047 RepID=A0A3D8QXJ7_9HELO|nr:hypothetical protein BP6252_10046 [Coleophoma cylindrospora]
MASPSTEPPKAPRDRVSAKSSADPVILRNTLRYTISAKEYQTLHKYIISRSRVLRRNAPTVPQVEKLVARPGGEDYNAAAVRASLRLFFASSAALKAYTVISERFLGKENSRGKKIPLWRSPNLRLSISLSTILLLHRILFRFFTRLRAHLLTPDAQPFRQRNKRTTSTLTSELAPAIGASLAGFALAVVPKDQLRVTIAIYSLSRAAEFAYNYAEDEGLIWRKSGRPWWWGSWLMMPIACGQLLHAFVFDRDCFPTAYGNFILKNSPQYVHQRPADYPSNLPWPTTYQVVDSLAQMARLHYPPFTSPILFPNGTTLPPSLSVISPITSPAHPLINSITCATLHPTDPSCLRTYLTYWIRVFPRLTRFFGVLFAVLSIPAYKRFYRLPITSLDALSRRVLKYSAFVAGSVGSSWGAICLFQNLLPRTVLPTQRFFLGGMIGGLWGFLVKNQGRGAFLYSARASMDSLWKVGKKHGWWKGVKGGDVWLFVFCLMVVNVVYERDARGIRSSNIRKGVSSLRGEGWRDWVREEDEKAELEGKPS